MPLSYIHPKNVPGVQSILYAKSPSLNANEVSTVGLPPPSSSAKNEFLRTVPSSLEYVRLSV